MITAWDDFIECLKGGKVEGYYPHEAGTGILRLENLSPTDLCENFYHWLKDRGHFKEPIYPPPTISKITAKE